MGMDGDCYFYSNTYLFHFITQTALKFGVVFVRCNKLFIVLFGDIGGRATETLEIYFLRVCVYRVCVYRHRLWVCMEVGEVGKLVCQEGGSVVAVAGKGETGGYTWESRSYISLSRQKL